MNVIETRDLCKQYGAALRVAHLNLNVPEGSVYGFLGPNGAGKSLSLIHISPALAGNAATLLIRTWWKTRKTAPARCRCPTASGPLRAAAPPPPAAPSTT